MDSHLAVCSMASLLANGEFGATAVEGVQSHVTRVIIFRPPQLCISGQSGSLMRKLDGRRVIAAWRQVYARTHVQLPLQFNTQISQKRVHAPVVCLFY